MEKKLHTYLCSDQAAGHFPDAHHLIHQSIIEEEYASELALLKNVQLEPRPEALKALLQTIAAQQVTAE